MKLRGSFGNIREFKRSLRTTSFNEAIARWHVVNQEYEAVVARHARLYGGGGIPLSDDLVTDATLKAKAMERPVLRAGATSGERKNFEMQEQAWLAVIEDFKSTLGEKYIDHERMEEDYRSGKFFEPGYETPYRPPTDDDTDVIALRHVEHGLSIRVKPTWRDACENYLSVNRADKIRDPEKQAIYERKTSSLFEKFGLSLGKQGSRTPLDLITRKHARDFKGQFRLATGNRYNNVLSAVINCWNQEHPQAIVQNPFSGLSNKLQESKHSVRRKSFTPVQWRKYVEILTEWPNKEIGLIGLIMAFTGCRTSEAAGLNVRDVRLFDQTPNLVFRSNDLRSMDKGGLERSVPIFDPLVSILKDHLLTLQGDGAMFKKYGGIRNYGNVSVQLNNIIRKKLNIFDKEIVAYSLRHTIHDKGRAARVDQAVHEYIVGHLSSGSSRIHQKYGTRMPPEALVDDMRAILNQDDWDTDFG